MIKLSLMSMTLLLTGCEAKAKARCTDNGGHIVEYDCHDYLECIQFDVGNGVPVPMCHWDRRCDHWRCDGAPAEAIKP